MMTYVAIFRVVRNSSTLIVQALEKASSWHPHIFNFQFLRIQMGRIAIILDGCLLNFKTFQEKNSTSMNFHARDSVAARF